MSVIYRALRRMQRDGTAPAAATSGGNGGTAPSAPPSTGWAHRRERLALWYRTRTTGQRTALLFAAALAVVATLGVTTTPLWTPWLSGSPDPAGPETVTVAMPVDDEADEDQAPIPLAATAPAAPRTASGMDRLLLAGAAPRLPGTSATRARPRGPSMDELAATLPVRAEEPPATDDAPPFAAASVAGDEGVTLPELALAARTPTTLEARTDRTRVVQVSRLTAEARDAMRAGRPDDVAAALDRLTEIRGDNDPFVMKMRAYWAIEEDRLEEARALLHDVLEARPGDLEAEINLTIVEARLGEAADARRRAHRLLARHPGDPKVRSLADRMGL